MDTDELKENAKTKLGYFAAWCKDFTGFGDKPEGEETRTKKKYRAIAIAFGAVLLFIWLTSQPTYAERHGFLNMQLPSPSVDVAGALSKLDGIASKVADNNAKLVELKGVCAAK